VFKDVSAVNKLVQTLSITRSQLAGILGVSLSCLADWEKGIKNEKLHRLAKLEQIIDYLQTNQPVIDKSDYKNLIDNARVIIDPLDEEDGSVTLQGLICLDTYNPHFFACVDSALLNVYGLNYKKL
jgi:transcriptional regulator with XRE-family HTH domain